MRWSEADNAALIRMANEGATIDECAKALQRPYDSVRKHGYTLGIRFAIPAKALTWNSGKRYKPRKQVRYGVQQ